MKFKITKSKVSAPNKATNFADKHQTSRFLNLNKDAKNDETDSKSVNMLFSLKSKTKMKRSHQKLNGNVLNTVFACQNQTDKELSSNKNYQINSKNEQKIKKRNFKQIGATFTNLFKSNKQNSILINGNIKIDNEKIFFPVPIRFESCKNDSPKLVVTEYPSGSVEIQNPDKEVALKSVSSLIQNFEERANQARKNQPLMGLKAYNIKTKSNSNKTDEVFDNDGCKCNNPNLKIFKNKSVIYDKKVKSGAQVGLDSFKSDSNLKRDLENQELYDCLVNYESNQLYRNTANDLKSLTKEMHLNLNSETETIKSDNNLAPFLDETRESFNPQPILSSTATDFDRDLSEFKLPLTPLRILSNISRMKKLRSFSNINIDN